MAEPQEAICRALYKCYFATQQCGKISTQQLTCFLLSRYLKPAGDTELVKQLRRNCKVPQKQVPTDAKKIVAQCAKVIQGATVPRTNTEALSCAVAP